MGSDTAQASALRIGFVMLHTSPLDVPGTKDAGGMNVVVRAQAEALARAGHDVTIFTRRSDADVPHRVELESGLAVVHLDAGPAELVPKGDHEAFMDDFGARLADEIEARPVDILHAEHWFSGVAGLPVARRFGIPLVQSYHSIAAPAGSPLTDGERPESPGRLAGEARLAREADRIIAVSAAERRTALERLGADEARVTVVELGVDTELFRPESDAERAEHRAWLRRGGRPEAIVVGRLHPLKGVHRAVEAIAAIAEGERPVLRVVGSPPPDGADYARELRDAVERYGMSDTTVFEGALMRSELAERVRAADLMLVPSYSETFGLVALEASASGVPVIARDTGGLRESVVDGVTGVLVVGDDASDWAAAVRGLLADDERALRFRAQARDHALAHNWEASARRLAAVYRDVIAGA